MKKLFIFIAASVAALAALSSCSLRDYGAEPVFGLRDDLLGTVLTISVYERARESVIESAFKRVSEIDGKMALTNPESEVCALNGAGGERTGLSDETAALINEARRYSSLSGGAFDISVEPLVRLWGISGENPRVPGEDELLAALALVGYEKIEVDTESGTVRLGAGQTIDLGAIAKGYACDEAVRILKGFGVKRAILDFGGNIYALGEKEGGAPWRIGIRSPLIGESGYIGVINVKNRAVVTSGGYERFFIQDGEVWHHIIDPATGYPSKSGVLSAPIICESSTMADALSTACFVMGADRGIKLLESLEGVEGIFICEDFTVRMTKAAAAVFSLEDERFDFVEEE